MFCATSLYNRTVSFFYLSTLWFSIVSMGGVMYNADRDGNKVTTVVATPGAGPDRPQEISYTDTKVIGNGSFGVVYLAKLCDTEELVAIKKVLQDKRFKVREKNHVSSIHLDKAFWKMPNFNQLSRMYRTNLSWA